MNANPVVGTEAQSDKIEKYENVGKLRMSSCSQEVTGAKGFKARDNEDEDDVPFLGALISIEGALII